MNSRQLNELNSDRVTYTSLLKEAKRVENIPRFINIRDDIGVSLCNIEQLNREMMIDIKGLIISKNDLRKLLTENILNTTSKLGAFSVSIDDTNLEKKVSCSRSYIKSLSDVEFKDLAFAIFALGFEYKNELVSFQLTEKEILDMMSLLKGFEQAIDEPRDIKAESKTKTAKIIEQLKHIKKQYLKLDKLIMVISQTDPDYLAKYFEMRKTLDLGRSKIALKAKVIDSLTKKPIKGVRVKFTFDQEGKIDHTLEIPSIIEKKTAVKGGFMVKNMQIGAYKAIFRDGNYHEHEQMVYVGEGYKTELIVEMVKR